mgnify:CR=1 FL=1
MFKKMFNNTKKEKIYVFGYESEKCTDVIFIRVKRIHMERILHVNGIIILLLL